MITSPHLIFSSIFILFYYKKKLTILYIILFFLGGQLLETIAQPKNILHCNFFLFGYFIYLFIYLLILTYLCHVE